MTNERSDGTLIEEEKKINVMKRPTFGNFLYSDPNLLANKDDNDGSHHHHHHHHHNHHHLRRKLSNANLIIPARSHGWFSPTSDGGSPCLSPWNQHGSPYVRSPWSHSKPSPFYDDDFSADFALPRCRLVGSLVRKEGHIYSLAASGDLLYTGSDSKNIRVWKNLKEFSGFKSNSGLVKAIIIRGNKIFTGHQDGKIRVWKLSVNTKKTYKRVGSLPTTKDYVKSSMNPKSYVEIRRNKIVPWIRHYDAVSCMSLDEDQGLLYSGSWDKTLKVWRIADYKCLESIRAHDDAVNSVAVGFSGLVFTGSADGAVKVWRRESVGKSETRHVLVQTLLRQGSAVTALAVNRSAGVVYGGTSEGVVNFWELEKWSLAHGGVLKGHRMAVLCLATAGDLVASGSADKTIRLWRRKGDEGRAHYCLTVLTGHCGPVKCLAAEEVEGRRADDGEAEVDRCWTVYSGSLDKSVKVWRVSERRPAAALKRQQAEG